MNERDIWIATLQVQSMLGVATAFVAIVLGMILGYHLRGYADARSGDPK